VAFEPKTVPENDAVKLRNRGDVLDLTTEGAVAAPRGWTDYVSLPARDDDRVLTIRMIDHGVASCKAGLKIPDPSPRRCAKADDIPFAKRTLSACAELFRGRTCARKSRENFDMNSAHHLEA
jgi:hypothetical protein